MTEGRMSYMGQTVETVRFATPPQTVMFSFEANGADRQELRKDVVFILNEMVDGPALGFSDYTIKRIVQFQVSEPWRYQVLGKWRCDVYVLCEIAPEPTALNQGLTAARMQMEDGKTLEVAAGMGYGSLQGVTTDGWGDGSER